MLVGMIAVYLPPVQYPFLLADLGITSTQTIGMGAAFGILSATAGTLLWPVLRRRFNTQSINVLVFALLTVGIWWLSRITSYAESFVVLAVHGLGAGMLVPNVMAWTMAAAKPWHMGKATGQVYFGLYFGQFLSPLLVAPLAASVGGLRPALVVVAAAMALFALIAFAIARKSTYASGGYRSLTQMVTRLHSHEASLASRPRWTAWRSLAQGGCHFGRSGRPGSAPRTCGRANCPGVLRILQVKPSSATSSRGEFRATSCRAGRLRTTAGGLASPSKSDPTNPRSVGRSVTDRRLEAQSRSKGFATGRTSVFA